MTVFSSSKINSTINQVHAINTFVLYIAYF